MLAFGEWVHHEYGGVKERCSYDVDLQIIARRVQRNPYGHGKTSYNIRMNKTLFYCNVSVFASHLHRQVPVGEWYGASERAADAQNENKNSKWNLCTARITF